jgi:hypothetical protein
VVTLYWCEADGWFDGEGSSDVRACEDCGRRGLVVEEAPRSATAETDLGRLPVVGSTEAGDAIAFDPVDGVVLVLDGAGGVVWEVVGVETLDEARGVEPR